MYVTVNNRPIQDYVHQDDHTQTYTYEMTPQPFTIIQFIMNKYCILRTKTKIIYFSTNQQSQSRAALHVGQVGRLPLQLSNLGQLKIAQAEIYFSVAS